MAARRLLKRITKQGLILQFLAYKEELMPLNLANTDKAGSIGDLHKYWRACTTNVRHDTPS